MIDVHAHYLAPSVLSRGLDQAGGVKYDPDRRVFEFPSGPARPVPPALTDLDQRARWMTERGIERQVLSPWMDIAGDDLPPQQAQAWCQKLNDATAEEIGQYEQFEAFAALPVAEGGVAAAELVRCVQEHGFRGGALPTQVNGVDLDGAGLEPLWEAAVGLDLPLFVHPYRVMGGSRMRAHFLHNVCGNPYETTLAALRLYFAGVLERWPGLKIILAHSGGVLVMLAGRAVQASRNTAAMSRPLDHPDDILRCFYYDTLLHDHRALSLVLSCVDTSRIVAGTDAPFPMLLDDPVGHVRLAGKQAGLEQEDFHRIFRLTATQLLNLGAPGGG